MTSLIFLPLPFLECWVAQKKESKMMMMMIGRVLEGFLAGLRRAVLALRKPFISNAVASAKDAEHSGSGVKDTADFSKIRYSQVWEDTATLRQALMVKQGDTVFSIASAGDNVFGLLLDDPAKIVALDFNPSQVGSYI